MGLIDGIMERLVRRKPSPFSTQGTGGTYTIGGFLQSNEKRSELSSLQNRVKKYNEMILNTAIIATGVRYFGSLLAGVGWTVEPAEDGGAKAEEIADLVEASMNAMDVPFYRVVRRMGQFKWLGFSIQEMIAKRMDEVKPGFIGIGSVEHRPQVTIEQWDLEEQSGYVNGWMQRDPNTGTVWPLSRSKCIYLVDDTLTDSPDGVGMLRHVVQLEAQLKKLEQLEGWAFETDLRGVPVAYAPTAVLDDLKARGKLTQAEYDQKLKGINDFVQNHLRTPDLGILLDSSVWTGNDGAKTSPSSTRMWGLELVKGQGTGLSEIAMAIERKQREIARALGIEQFMLGADGKGSLALSEDKTANLTQLVNSCVVEIAWTLENDFLDFLFAVNNWDTKLKPKLKPDAVHLRSVSEIVTALKDLAAAGATLMPNDPVVEQVRDMLDLVEPPEIDDELAGIMTGMTVPVDPNKIDPKTGKPYPREMPAGAGVAPGKRVRRVEGAKPKGDKVKGDTTRRQQNRSSNAREAA